MIRVGGKYKHARTGAIYKVILITNWDSTDHKKFPTTVCYQRENSASVWSRKASEFDLKFIELKD